MTPFDADRHLRIDHLNADLRRRTIRGGLIAICAQGSKIIFQFGAIIILARILPPRAFGLIAMSASINVVLEFAKELGLSAATIQRPDISHEQVSVLFWVNVAAGSVIMGAVFLLAPVLADFYREPEILGITRWMSVGFFFSGLAVQHWALLRRQMRFAATAGLDNGADVASLALAVIVALAGGGYWALVVQRLLQPLIVLVGSWWLCRWRPGPPRRAEGVITLLRYGASLTISNFSFAISRSIDQIFIGWWWGPIQLGLYERAAKLALAPVTNIQVPLYSVGMPSLSRIVDQPQRYRNVFTGLLEKLAMCLIPGGIGVAVSSKWVVLTLFGSEWIEISPLVACFALAASVQPLASTTSLLFLTQNRPREIVRAGFIDACLCIMSFLIGLPWGITSIAVSFALVILFVRVPMAFWLVSRRGPVTFGDLWNSVYPGLIAGIAVAATTWGMRSMLEVRGVNPALGLLILLSVAILTSLFAFATVPRTRYIIRAMFGGLSAIHISSLAFWR